MYRKRRKTQSFFETSRSRFSFGFKMILVSTAVLAALSALITGAVLSKKVSDSSMMSYGRHNLTEFGGVEKAAEDYANLKNIRAEYVTAIGMDKSAFKKEVAGSEKNAVAFKANDGEGNLFFATTLSEKADLSFNVASKVTASELVEVIADNKKLSIAYFYVSAFKEKDSRLKILKAAEELAVASELCTAGLNEIVLSGFSDVVNNSAYITSYMSWLDAVCTKTNICVALSENDISTSNATALINATEGYADAYAIDMSNVENSELGTMIEKCAYFITQYNTRVMVKASSDKVQNETIAILEAYGIKSYTFVE